MTISKIREGQLGLHIISFNDIPREEWLSKIRNQEEQDYIINDPLNFLARIPEHRVELLDIVASNRWEASTVSPQVEPHLVYAVDTPTNSYKGTPSGFVRPEVVITDKGSFSSLQVLTQNLKAIFPLSQNVSAVISATKQSMGLQQEITYLSMPVYTRFIIIAKKLLDDDLVRSLGGDPAMMGDVDETQEVHTEVGKDLELPVEVEPPTIRVTHSLVGTASSKYKGSILFNYTSHTLAKAAAKLWNDTHPVGEKVKVILA